MWKANCPPDETAPVNTAELLPLEAPHAEPMTQPPVSTLIKRVDLNCEEGKQVMQRLCINLLSELMNLSKSIKEYLNLPQRSLRGKCYTQGPWYSYNNTTPTT